MSEMYSQPAESGGASGGGHDRSPVVVGVDAGGTRTRACLAEARPGGRVLGRGSGGPGNALSVGRADLTAHLAAAVGAAVAEALPADPGVRARVAAAYGGFAGAAPGLGPERGKDLAVSCLRDALTANGIGAVPVGVGGDTEVALAAAPGAPGDGLVLIAGTGAIASRLAGGRPAAVSDGHGWLLGDEGSGYWLGSRAARAALEALDGRGPWTSLVPRVVAHFLGADRAPRTVADSGGPVARHALGEALVARAYAEPPARLAALSPLVVAAAADADPVARALLDRAGELLAATVQSLSPRPGEPLAATGALLAPHGPLLSRVTAHLAPHRLRIHPVADPSDGAAALAHAFLQAHPQGPGEPPSGAGER